MYAYCCHHHERWRVPKVTPQLLAHGLLWCCLGLPCISRFLFLTWPRHKFKRGDSFTLSSLPFPLYITAGAQKFLENLEDKPLSDWFVSFFNFYSVFFFFWVVTHDIHSKTATSLTQLCFNVHAKANNAGAISIRSQWSTVSLWALSLSLDPVYF